MMNSAAFLLSLLLLLVSSVSGQGSVNETANCESQLGKINADSDVTKAWDAVEDSMFFYCDEEVEGACDYDKTGTKIIYTYDFGVVAVKNESATNYDTACKGVTGEITRVRTISDEAVTLACKAETSDHIPYEVHLENYFFCAGIACDDGDELVYQNAIDFAVKVVDENQNGVTCELGTHSGAASLTGSVAFVVMAATGALFALF